MLFLLAGCGGDNKNKEQKNESKKYETTEIVDTIPAITEQESQKPDQKVEAKAIKVTFIELGSVKCIPCKKMQPIMEEIEKEYGDQVKVVFYDVWTEQAKPYAEKYRVRLIPTQIFLDENGIEYFRHEGFFPKEELVKVLKEKGVN